MRGRDAARLAYGLVLLAAPQHAATSLAGARLDGRGRVVVRVLGARHVAQAVVLAVDDRTLTRRVGRLVDLLHAGSMLLLAAWAPGRGRIALTDAGVAMFLAGRADDPAKTTGRPASRRQETSAPSDPRYELLQPPVVPVVGVNVLDERDELDESRTRREHNASRQEAIYEAFRDAKGGPLDAAKAALSRSIARRGLPLPAASWLEAVAADITEGNLYVVSGPAMEDAGLDLPPHQPL